MTPMQTDRPETPLERARREAIERAARETPLHGKPLPQRARLERATLDRYLRAAGGPLAYMRRLRAIEAAIREHELALEERRAELRRTLPADRFTDAWRAAAEAWDFGDVNALIEQHNRWYPVEAQLPMDPRTGEYRLVGGRPYRRRPLDAAWVLARYPAERTAA
jgi:hypothetical protein